MEDQERLEALGPAERIVQALVAFTSHVNHGRPGVVGPDGRTVTGVRWEPATWIQENGEKIAYRLTMVGKKKDRTRLGVLNDDNTVEGTDREYRKSGLFPEAAAYLYRQVAEVWKMDNDFAARWASWAYRKGTRDLKVIMAAFMLVQSRSGGPVRDDDGTIMFFDEDHREVGEAICLDMAKQDRIDAKLLLRVGDVLRLPEIAAINRELGFGRSARNPAMGRWPKVVEKWLRYREQNLPLLEGLVKAGFRTKVMELARRVGYKPESEKFFELLRWKQVQAKDGRREVAIGKVVKAADTWEGLSETEVCERIERDKPSWKRIAGLLPKDVGVTQAVMACAVENGCLSEADLVIATPTLEELGLLQAESVRTRWEAALKAAEDRRAANIARNVRTKEAQTALEDAADEATAKVVEESVRDMRVYVIVDKSGSMQDAIEQAKGYLKRLLVAFPLEKLHISVFNTAGTEIELKVAKAAAVEHAFSGHRAGGGTCYGEGVRALMHHKPAEDEDALMIFVGDQLDDKTDRLAGAVEASGIKPVAFGMLQVGSNHWGFQTWNVVYDAAKALGIPCFPVDENMFTSDDPYAMVRILRDLVAATPVGKGGQAARRKSLVEEVLSTDLLTKPVWA